MNMVVKLILRSKIIDKMHSGRPINMRMSHPFHMKCLAEIYDLFVVNHDSIHQYLNLVMLLFSVHRSSLDPCKITAMKSKHDLGVSDFQLSRSLLLPNTPSLNILYHRLFAQNLAELISPPFDLEHLNLSSFSLILLRPIFPQSIINLPIIPHNLNPPPFPDPRKIFLKHEHASEIPSEPFYLPILAIFMQNVAAPYHQGFHLCPLSVPVDTLGG
jgi:hypothetical protein